MYVRGRKGLRPFQAAWCVTVAVLLAAGAAAWSEGKAEYGTGTELVTSSQHVEVVYRSSQAEWVKVYIDQIERDQLKGSEPPFKNVANIQIFRVPSSMSKAVSEEGFIKALRELGKKDLAEVTTFPTPLHIVLKRVGSDTTPIRDFAMRIGQPPNDAWIVWRSADPKASRALFLKNDIDADFSPGNPAVITIRGWPAGDPCMSH
jgi:hypothetical protein